MSDLPSTTPVGARLGLEPENSLSPAHLLALQADESAAVARQAVVHGLLPLALANDAAKRAFTARVTTAILPQITTFTHQLVARLERDQIHRASPQFHSTKQPSITGSVWPFLRLSFAALAASLMIVILVSSNEVMVANIVRSESASWSVPNRALIAGSHLHLAGGLVELDLLGRGQLIVEGPADVELASATRAVLHNGRMVFNATPAGHGYRIETPSGTLIDIGTRFGVSVAADGTAEAHVIEGSISVIAGTKEMILLQNDAARLISGKVERITGDPGSFYSNLPPHDGARANELRWRFDEGQGLTAHAETRGFSGLVSDLTLRSVRDGPLPEWSVGIRGHALAFNGRGGFAESDFPGIAGTQARSIACWIRVPRDFTPADGFALVSWGQFSNADHGAVWQLSVNPLVQDGPLGRVRVGTHGGLLVGTTDLRDNTWHHITVVMFGGAPPDIGTHVLVYVDGRLESISRRTLLAINTRITKKSHGMWVGRNITDTDDDKPHPQAFFRGGLDDLVITAGALSSSEIQLLMSGR